MAYGLIEGRLWPAAVCALGALWVLDAYRRDKRSAESFTKEESAG